MKTFGKIILIVMLATIVVPVGYLAWRAGQPMELPQFNGLTYYQYMNWRKTALRQMAVEYQATHPNAKMGGGLDMCYNADTALNLGLGLPINGFYTLAGVFPKLERFVPARDRKYVPETVGLRNFLSSWWLTFEKYTWYMADTTPHTSVVYCRLQPDIPTPEEYEAMQEKLVQAANP
jgi:hypothetical protein